MDEKLQEALNQVAIEQLRADQAEQATGTEKARADAAEGALATAKVELEQLKTVRADSADASKLGNQITVLKGQLTALKTRLDAAESPAKVRELVKDRVALETKASIVLGDKVRLDEMDDRALMATVVEKLHGTSLEGKSIDYVRARFDSAVESHAAGAAAIDRVRELVEDNKSKDEKVRTDSRSPRQKFLDAQNNAWKPAQS